MSGLWYANTTVSIYRTLAASADEYGNYSDNNTTVLASAVPAAVSESNYMSLTGSDMTKGLPGTFRTTLVEEFTIRMRPQTDVEEGDRLRDERNDLWFQVTNVARQYGTLGYSDVRVGATRIGNESQPVNG